MLLCYTEDLIMGGNTLTSTQDVTTKGQQSLCLKSNTETASVASQLLSGHLLTLKSLLVIATRCCLTCLSKGTSPTNEQAKRYTAVDTGDLLLVEMVPLN
jgi:hypothetical protein